MKQQDRTVWLQKSGHVTHASKHLKAIRIVLKSGMYGGDTQKIQKGLIIKVVYPCMQYINSRKLNTENPLHHSNSPISFSFQCS